MIFKRSSYLKDPETMETLKTINVNLHDILLDEEIQDKFCSNYVHWLTTSKNNTVTGLELYPHVLYSQGTSESFDKFYIRNRNRRFRCFRGEYMYHQLAWRNSWPAWKFIEDDGLAPTDAVVISLPFSDTGCVHSRYDEVIKQCNELNVPVLIDAIYYSVASNINLDLTHVCITDVLFGLSKTFPLAHARVGMRLTKIDDDDTLFVYQKGNYTNRIGAYLGNVFLNEYGPDYIVNKYKHKQEEFCKILEVCPSDTVSFGLGGSKWSEYNRGTDTNRLGLHEFLPLSVEEFKNKIKDI
jgi:hypothetical protein